MVTVFILLYLGEFVTEQSGHLLAVDFTNPHTVLVEYIDYDLWKDEAEQGNILTLLRWREHL